MSGFDRTVTEKQAQHSLLTAVRLYKNAGCRLGDFLVLVLRFWRHTAREGLRIQHWLP